MMSDSIIAAIIGAIAVIVAAFIGVKKNKYKDDHIVIPDNYSNPKSQPSPKEEEVGQNFYGDKATPYYSDQVKDGSTSAKTKLKEMQKLLFEEDPEEMDINSEKYLQYLDMTAQISKNPDTSFVVYKREEK